MAGAVLTAYEREEIRVGIEAASRCLTSPVALIEHRR